MALVEQIIFIYDVDSSILSLLLTSMQKIIRGASACGLCSATYGITMKKKEWIKAEKNFGRPIAYYHRDALPQAIRDFCILHNVAFPVVLFLCDGEYRVALSSEAIQECGGNPVRLGTAITDALLASP